MGLRIIGLMLLGLGVAVPVYAGALDTVRAEKVLRVAYRSDVPPFSSARAQEAPTGFSIDLCRLVAERLSKQLGLPSLAVDFVKVSASDRLQAIIDGRAHIECGTTTVTFSRLEKVDFSVSSTSPERAWWCAPTLRFSRLTTWTVAKLP